MTNEQLEEKFEEAKARWNATNVHQIERHDDYLRLARYFFWSGGQVGIEATRALYQQHVGSPPMMTLEDAPDETS